MVCILFSFLGFENPLALQQRAIKTILKGKDVILQGGPYVFERFLEAALRPWIDSDKNFVNKKGVSLEF